MVFWEMKLLLDGLRVRSLCVFSRSFIVAFLVSDYVSLLVLEVPAQLVVIHPPQRLPLSQLLNDLAEL
jgi:hypothetical protein